MPRARSMVFPFLLAFAACGEPIGIIPGGVLSGDEATASSWSEVVSESGTLELETRPQDPYSVRIGYVFSDGNIYIDPAEERNWYHNIKDDPSVRVRFGNRIYRARAVAVTDPAELEDFGPDRRVLRLELANSPPVAATIGRRRLFWCVDSRNRIAVTNSQKLGFETIGSYVTVSFFGRPPLTFGALRLHRKLQGSYSMGS